MDSHEQLDPRERLREELSVASVRAEFVMSRLAMSVRTDRVPARDHLYDALDRLVEGRKDSELGRARMLLVTDIELFLAGRRGHKRSVEARWLESKRLLDRATRHLPEEDPALWRLRMREAESRARIPLERPQALKDIRTLLDAAGHPERTSFELSIHAMNFAVLLRIDEDVNLQHEAEDITDREATRRREIYGAEHPFTLVAEAHRLVLKLGRLERSHDAGPLGQIERSRAEQLATEVHRLHKRRSAVLGERHGGTVMALGYEARALRLSGGHEESRALAVRALAQRGVDQDTNRDDTLPPILRIVIADALAFRFHEADMNAIAAEARLRQENNPQLRRPLAKAATQERERANVVRAEILTLISEATKVLGHQQSQRIWMERAEAIGNSIDEKT